MARTTEERIPTGDRARAGQMQCWDTGKCGSHFSKDFVYERPLTLAEEVQCRGGKNAKPHSVIDSQPSAAHSWGMVLGG